MVCHTICFYNNGFRTCGFDIIITNLVPHCSQTVLVHVMLVLNPCFSTTAAGLASLRLGHKCETFGTNLSKLADELSEVNTHGIVSGFTNAYLTAIKGVVDSFIKQLCSLSKLALCFPGGRPKSGRSMTDASKSALAG